MNTSPNGAASLSQGETKFLCHWLESVTSNDEQRDGGRKVLVDFGKRSKCIEQLSTLVPSLDFLQLRLGTIFGGKLS